MQYRLPLLACLLGLTAALTCAAEYDKTIRLTSLEWPPYAGAALESEGASSLVVRQALKAMGYDLQVEFFPWSRAIKLVKTDDRYHGYFPEYLTAATGRNFNCVGSIGEGPLALAQRKVRPVSWRSLDDLSAYRIGVVRDFVNTDEFDARVASKQIMVDVAPTDMNNLLKLELGRLDLAVVDGNVFNYMLHSSPRLRRVGASLELNPKILESKKLYVCFKNGPQGKKWAQVLREGLSRINVQAVNKNYFTGHAPIQ